MNFVAGMDAGVPRGAGESQNAAPGWPLAFLCFRASPPPRARHPRLG